MVVEAHLAIKSAKRNKEQNILPSSVGALFIGTLFCCQKISPWLDPEYWRLALAEIRKTDPSFSESFLIFKGLKIGLASFLFFTIHFYYSY